MEKLSDLEGQVLGCWCRDPTYCHGTVLIRLCKEQAAEKNKEKK